MRLYIITEGKEFIWEDGNFVGQPPSWYEEMKQLVESRKGMKFGYKFHYEKSKRMTIDEVFEMNKKNGTNVVGACGDTIK